MKRIDFKKAITKELTDIAEECFLKTLFHRDVFEEKVSRALDLYLPFLEPTANQKPQEVKQEDKLDAQEMANRIIINDLHDQIKELKEREQKWIKAFGDYCQAINKQIKSKDEKQ